MPSDTRGQSEFLLVTKSTDPLVNIKATWQISSYQQKILPISPYTYLADRFRQKAIANIQCDSSLLVPDRLNYCNGVANLTSVPAGNTVWFIDGNLSVNNDFTVGSSDTITFVVSGNIIVDDTVINIHGIYIAGGTFQSTTTDEPTIANQLVVNGAVYAKALSLNRSLSNDPPCGLPCDNSQTPAENFVFEPKYLVKQSDLLGSPSFSWKEIAP